MRAIAVLPGKPNSIHLAELPKPSVHEIPNGRGILVHKAKDRSVREKRYTTFSAFGPIDDDSEEAVDPSRFQRSGKWVGQGAFPPQPWDDQTPEKLLASRQAVNAMQQAIDVRSAPLKKILILRDVDGVGEAPQRLSTMPILGRSNSCSKC